MKNYNIHSKKKFFHFGADVPQYLKSLIILLTQYGCHYFDCTIEHQCPKYGEYAKDGEKMQKLQQKF